MNRISKLFALSAAFALIAAGCTKPEPEQPAEPEKPAPSITSITPDSGLAGDPVIIKGSNFSAEATENTVKFGATEATVLKASARQLSVLAPEGNPGEVEVTVTVDGVSSEPVKFTYNEPVKPAVVKSMTPDRTAVGEKVTLDGENFGTEASAVAVAFGNAAAEVVSVTDTKIEVIVPEGSGEVVVTVTIGDAQPVSAGLFTYIFLREVTVTGLSKCLVTTGDELEILCSGFSETIAENKVTVGETELEIVELTATGIKVRVPALPLGDAKAVVATKSAASVETPVFAFYQLPSYTVSTVIGNGTAKNVEGVGTEASVQLPEYVGFGPDGYLWMTARGGTATHAILRANPADWSVSIAVPSATVGSGVYYWGGDFNSKGEFHVCGKGKNYIGKVVKDGDSYSLSTYTVSGAAFKSCMNLIFDDNDHAYVADRDNKRVVQCYNGEFEKSYELGVQPYTLAWDARKENIIFGTNASWGIYRLCLADGKVTQICGSTKPAAATYTDGEDPSKATVGNVSGIVVDKNGYVWFNDALCHTFRVLVPGPEGDYAKGLVRTVAGTPCASGFNDGDGASAKFKAPGMLAVDADGNFYIADGSNNRIRRISAVK